MEDKALALKVNDDDKILGSCFSCDSSFAIPTELLQDEMKCPKCGHSIDIIIICPSCNREIRTSGRSISVQGPCPACDQMIIYNIVKSTSGNKMVVSMTGRIELHDLAAMASIMNEKSKESNEPSKQKTNGGNKKTLTEYKRPDPKGCLGSVVAIISLGASFLTAIILINW